MTGVAGIMRRMGRPDNGMFSIKLISPDYRNYPHSTDDFDGTDGRLPLMSFSREGKGPYIAARIPIGHRSLVYVARHQKFIWAIEYIGTTEDGQRAALAHGIPPNTPTKWSINLPIRFLARVDLNSAPTAEEIEKRTGIRFKANSFTMKYITADEYQRIYDAIPWQWTIGDGPWTSAAPLPSPKPPRTDCAPTPDGGTNIQPKPPEFVLPPIPNAESLVARIRQVRGMPERNMEDVVKAFLISLGHPESAISFQVGHVDVRVNDEQGKTRMVVEVKRSLQHDKVWRDALRKGFDYATRLGASQVVITDSDIYEVFDRRLGLDYDSTRCGRFQVTKFVLEDGAVLDLLRPANTTLPDPIPGQEVR